MSVVEDEQSFNDFNLNESDDEDLINLISCKIMELEEKFISISNYIGIDEDKSEVPNKNNHEICENQLINNEWINYFIDIICDLFNEIHVINETLKKIQISKNKIKEKFYNLTNKYKHLFYNYSNIRSQYEYLNNRETERINYLENNIKIISEENVYFKQKYKYLKKMNINSNHEEISVDYSLGYGKDANQLEFTFGQNLTILEEKILFYENIINQMAKEKEHTNESIENLRKLITIKENDILELKFINENNVSEIINFKRIIDKLKNENFVLSKKIDSEELDKRNNLKTINNLNQLISNRRKTSVIKETNFLSTPNHTKLIERRKFTSLKSSFSLILSKNDEKRNDHTDYHLSLNEGNNNQTYYYNKNEENSELIDENTKLLLKNRKNSQESQKPNNNSIMKNDLEGEIFLGEILSDNSTICNDVYNCNELNLKNQFRPDGLKLTSSLRSIETGLNIAKLDLRKIRDDNYGNSFIDSNRSTKNIKNQNKFFGVDKSEDFFILSNPKQNYINNFINFNFNNCKEYEKHHKLNHSCENIIFECLFEFLKKSKVFGKLVKRLKKQEIKKYLIDKKVAFKSNYSYICDYLLKYELKYLCDFLGKNLSDLKSNGYKDKFQILLGFRKRNHIKMSSKNLIKKKKNIVRKRKEKLKVMNCNCKSKISFSNSNISYKLKKANGNLEHITYKHSYDCAIKKYKLDFRNFKEEYTKNIDIYEPSNIEKRPICKINNKNESIFTKSNSIIDHTYSNNYLKIENFFFYIKSFRLIKQYPIELNNIYDKYFKITNDDM